jgi:uncharacterized protein YggE
VRVIRSALLASLVAGLVSASPAAAQTAAPAERTITVVGMASVTAPNDTAGVSFGVTTAHRSPAAALADTSARTQRVIGALTAAGIPKADVQTQTVSLDRSVRPRRGHRKRRVLYTARNSVSVVVRNIATTGAVIQAAVGAGATSVSGVEFSASNANDLYRRALGLAYDDAHAKAEALAQHAGATLGRPISIQEGQQDFTNPSAQTVAAPPGAAAPPIEPGSATVDAFVTVVFAIS